MNSEIISEPEETRTKLPEQEELSEQPERSDSSDSSDSSDLSDDAEAADGASLPSIPELIAEAERRGYQRAINEFLKASRSRPVMFEDLARRRAEAPVTEQETPEPEPDNLSSRFLDRIRPGVWD